ncbi:MAG: hypothetical protein QOE33_867 [Acidobacteriota bacterium]|nr:hypothetical protein [Acidobacteriota bacterium]
MQITVHQAIYGEVNGAWDLLATSLPNNAIAKKIRFQTDLQDRPPSGIVWQPVVRGFAVDEFYLVTKTYPDNSPNVRSGRVFSHSLIIKKNDLNAIDNLELLLSYFSENIDKSISLSPIDYQANSHKECVIDEEIIPRFNKLIHGIAEAEQYQNVIVWIGQEYFALVVCVAWSKLSKSERESFSFGVNFNPKEVPKGNLTLITTPSSLENRWLNTGFCVVKKTDSYQLTSFFELYLSGDVGATNKLNNFIRDIEATSVEREDLAFLSKGVPTYENIDLVQDFNSINTLYQIISEYSPNKKKGVTLKRKLLSRLSNIIRTSSEKEILALRNIKPTAVENSEPELSTSLQAWIKSNLLALTASKENNYSKIIKQYKSKSTPNWWNVTLDKELKRFISNISLEKAEIIWQWVLKDMSVLETLKADLDDSNQGETALITKFPDETNSGWLSSVKKFALKRNWLKLYATTLIREFDFQEALSEQLKVDTNEKYVEGINIITASVKPERLIKFSIVDGDSRLLNICGDLCHNNPSLLSKLEIQNKNWRYIWLKSIKRGNKIDDGIIKPQTKIYEVLDLIVKGTEIDEDLVQQISLSDYANVLEYKNRNGIWKKLSSKSRENFLAETSADLLHKISKNPSIEIPDDDFLEEYIINNGMSNFLYFNRDDFKKTLPIFLKFSQLGESNLEDYVYNYKGKLDIVDATQLGRLVGTRNYGRVAKAIYHQAGRDSAFKVALNECYFLLGLFDQASIKLTGFLKNISFNEDKWWEALQEIAYTLYSEGPKDRKIWMEAGGQEYDLLSHGTGKEVWIDALHKLRYGAYREITIQKLLKKMVKEHPRYEPLKMLQELRNKL